MRALLRNGRGTSAVEFALIAPFLLLLVGAILAYGTIFATSLSLQQLAAETARATIGGLNDSERESLAQAHLDAMADSYPMLNASALSFTFDAASGGEQSSVTLQYDMTNHPAYALEELIPLPDSPLSYSMVVTDGDGASS
jgi:Flp pilus assembly protein TadG